MEKKQGILKKDKEEVIFDAALKVIGQRGFKNARMSDITREAGISYGLVYHYFTNKDELFKVIADRYFDDIFRMLEMVRDSYQDGGKKLRQFTLNVLDNFQKRPELVKVFTTEVSRSPVLMNRTHLIRFKKLFSAIEDVIKKGQEEGIFRADLKARYLTYIYLGAIEVFVSAMVLDNQKIKSDKQKKRIADSIHDVFINGAKNQKR